MIEVLLKDFRRVHQRSVRASIAPVPSTGPAPMWLPPRLLDSVRDGTAVLMLGAGASLQAGLPSATAFLDAMIEQIRETDPSYLPSSSGTPFNAVATDFFSLLGEAELQKMAVGLIDPPYVTGPTNAHRIAARLFDTILTTNYDTLLEQAVNPEITRVIQDEPTASDLASAKRVFKLHGSINEPATLILTETELTNIEQVRPAIWREAKNLLESRPLLSVGSSLRDPSLVRLLEACQPRLSGWAVLPEFGKADRLRLERWGLEAVQGDADSLMQILADALR